MQGCCAALYKVGLYFKGNLKRAFISMQMNGTEICSYLVSCVTLRLSAILYDWPMVSFFAKGKESIRLTMFPK